MVLLSGISIHGDLIFHTENCPECTGIKVGHTRRVHEATRQHLRDALPPASPASVPTILRLQLPLQIRRDLV